MNEPEPKVVGASIVIEEMRQVLREDAVAHLKTKIDGMARKLNEAQREAGYYRVRCEHLMGRLQDQNANIAKWRAERKAWITERRMMKELMSLKDEKIKAHAKQARARGEPTS